MFSLLTPQTASLKVQGYIMNVSSEIFQRYYELQCFSAPSIVGLVLVCPRKVARTGSRQGTHCWTLAMAPSSDCLLVQNYFPGQVHFLHRYPKAGDISVEFLIHAIVPDVD